MNASWSQLAPALNYRPAFNERTLTNATTPYLGVIVQRAREPLLSVTVPITVPLAVILPWRCAL
jgi:DNA-binding LacI/PurR family transcriptional regulator